MKTERFELYKFDYNAEDFVLVHRYRSREEARVAFNRLTENNYKVVDSLIGKNAVIDWNVFPKNAEEKIAWERYQTRLAVEEYEVLCTKQEQRERAVKEAVDRTKDKLDSMNQKNLDRIEKNKEQWKKIGAFFKKGK